VENPAKSSVEKGQKFHVAITNEIGEFIVEIARADKSNLYK
jgi:hypothetical protein